MDRRVCEKWKDTISFLQFALKMMKIVYDCLISSSIS